MDSVEPHMILSREKLVRAVSAVLGASMLLAGSAFLLAVLTDTLPGRELLSAASQFAFGWLFLSHGLGWQSPFRRSIRQSE